MDELLSKKSWIRFAKISLFTLLILLTVVSCGKGGRKKIINVMIDPEQTGPGLPLTPGQPGGGLPISPGQPGSGLPVVPGQPGGGIPVSPGQPGQPGLPVTPAPGNPGSPGNPGQPGMPVSPGQPGQPGIPVTPGNPSQPGVPALPGPGNPSNPPSIPGNPGSPGNPGGGNPGNPGGPGSPSEPTEDYRYRAEEFYYQLPNGQLHLLFIVDDSETMEGIRTDLIAQSSKFGAPFAKENLSHVQLKVGFLTSSSPSLVSVNDKILLSNPVEFDLIPQYFKKMGAQGSPYLESYSSLLRHFNQNIDIRGEGAFIMLVFIHSDEMIKDIDTTSFFSNLTSQYHPAYLTAFAGIFRIQSSLCYYRDAVVSDKLVQLMNSHLYSHSFELCELRKGNYYQEIAKSALKYSQKIILKKVPYRTDWIYLYYEDRLLEVKKDFGFRTETNEIIIYPSARIPREGRIVVHYWYRVL